MLQYGGKRLDIVLSMRNPFNYAEFKSKCDVEKVPCLPPHVFAQKVGMIMCARTMYPDLEVGPAYLKFVEDWKDVPTHIPATPCGGCGGGKVR